VSRGYGANKKQREDERARKRADKERRRKERREHGPGEVPVEEGQAAATAESPSLEEIMRSLDNRTRAPRAAPPIPSRLFVGGLAHDVTNDQLRQTFEAIGPVADVHIVRDRESGTPRGFGFVTMGDRKDASRAIEELHGTELAGQRLVVNVATERGR
jgi:RNA recognition motif-containing protein